MWACARGTVTLLAAQACTAMPRGCARERAGLHTTRTRNPWHGTSTTSKTARSHRWGGWQREHPPATQQAQGCSTSTPGNSNPTKHMRRIQMLGRLPAADIMAAMPAPPVFCRGSKWMARIWGEETLGPMIKCQWKFFGTNFPDGTTSAGPGLTPPGGGGGGMEIWEGQQPGSAG